MNQTRLLLIAILALASPVWAAFPTVAAREQSLTTPGSTSHVVDLPTGIVAGNLLVVQWGYATGSAEAIANPNTSFPAGWTTQHHGACGGTECWGTVGIRLADGTEGSTITVTTSISVRSSHISYRITGNNGSTVTSNTATGTVSNPNPPSVTPVGGARDYLWLITVSTFADCVTTGTLPANYSTLHRQAAEGTSSAVLGAERQLNAASEDPAAFTSCGGSRWIAMTMAVHPLEIVPFGGRRMILSDILSWFLVREAHATDAWFGGH